MAEQLERYDSATGTWIAVAAVNRTEVIEYGGTGLQADVICLLSEDLTGCTSANDGAVYYGRPLTLVYTAKDNFILPEDATVVMNGTALTQGTDFTWSRSTGILSIPQVRGNIAVTVTAFIYGGLYIQADYIESSGEQYIDTGIIGDGGTTAMEATFAKISTYPNYWWAVFGACQQDIVRSFLFAVYNNGNTKCNVQAGTNRYADINYSFTLHRPCTVKRDRQYTYIDGVLVSTLSAYSYTTPVNIGIFKQLYSVSSNCSNARMRLYGAKIWQSGVLVRRFIPCVRASDAAVGLFDDVGGVFYENAGTGSFTDGSYIVSLLTNNLRGCARRGDRIVYFNNSPATITYTADENFTLPDTVTVKMGGVTLSQGTDFTWTQGMGELYIPSVTGDIEVTVFAELDGNLYTQCDYIESSGEQYIDTGIYGNGGTSAEVVFAPPSAPFTQYLWAVIGACESYIIKSFLFAVDGDGSEGCEVQLGTNRYGDISFSFTPLTPYKVYINKNKVYIDDVLKLTLSAYSYTTPVTVTLFRQNYSSSSNCGNAQMRLYSCKMWNGDDLVRWLIPCVRNSDGAVGMYDEAGGVFYGNAGSGVFGYG